MARTAHAGTLATTAFRRLGSLLALSRVGTVFTAWDAETGGTRYTDLLDSDGSTPITEITIREIGQVPVFYPPDGVEGVWLDDGDGKRTFVAPNTTEALLGNLNAHKDDTTDVHGIPDTSLLLSSSSTLQTGDLLRFDGTNLVRTTTGFFEGTGSPEGVVAAPPGSTFRNTEDGGYNGVVEWTKRTGTGNTGWVVSVGDTGRRDISSLLINGWSGSSAGVLLARVGTAVFVVAGLDGTAATATEALTLPSGFRPSAWTPILLTDATVPSVNPSVYRMRLRGGGQVEMPTGFALNVFTSWPTADAWPITLPGTAA